MAIHKLLLIEDEKNFGNVLKNYLQLSRYDVTWAEDGEKGMELLKQQRFDLCIVDVMMPKKDGYTFAEEMRDAGYRVPFIFLTARQQKEDMIKGYMLGADDYITKPFDTEVLLLKIKALLKRSDARHESEAQYTLCDYTFEPRLRALRYKQQEPVKLSPKESALLTLLCMHQNDILPREKALKQIWKEDTYFTARSMDVYIVKLRKFLQHDARIEIRNLHGNGYSLNLK